MKRSLFVVAFVAASGWAIPETAQGQTGPEPAALPRIEVSGSIGWLNVNKTTLADTGSNDWVNSGLYGGGTFGWHWTEHHKLEVEAAASRSGQFFVYEQFSVGTVFTSRVARYRFFSGRLAVSERYQFRHNTWFHPHVGVGVELVRETATEREDAVFVFDQVTRQTREVRPARETRDEPDFGARVFGDIGFKAYFAPRSFFRTDFRLAGGTRLDDVLLKFGFGVDF